jgi:arginine/lysine/ornithine decarboxylase
MLPAMTMSAMLHIQGTRAPKQRIEQHLRILQSSSPSYPLLASIDLARRYAALEAPQQITKSIANINAFLLINKQPLNADPFKWVLRDPTGTYSGYELYNKFVEHGIYPELADPTYVVFYFGLETTDEVLSQLQKAVNAILPTYVQNGARPLLTNPSKRDLTPRVVRFSRQLLDQPAIAVALDEAIGHKVAEMVIPYPPGVAMLFPGDVITAAHIEQLKQLQAAKAHVQGVADSTLNTIRIFREEDIR